MNIEQNTKNKVLSGLFWKLLERGGTQGIQFVVQIILARLLLPEDYGTIALVAVFIAVANVFVQSGFNTALIQRKHADDLDFSSVFYLSLSVAGIIYIILFFVAPIIAIFYNEQQLIPVLRVLTLTLFFGAVNSIQSAVVSRAMQFKRFFFSSIGAMLASGIVGIVLANAGFGVWALVGQQLTSQFMVTAILWSTVRWRPKWIFSIERLKGLFSFGCKLLCSGLIDTIYNNVYSLVIGKVYNPEILGYFNRGDTFPKLMVTNINGSIQSVIFPALSFHQDDIVRVKAMVRRSIVTSSFFILPMMTGLAVVAEPLVKILLTDKWLPCVPFLRFMCIAYAFWPIHTANLQAINAVGRSDIFLKLEIIKKCVGITALCVSIPYGIYVMVAFKPVTAVISSVINAFPNKTLLGYSYIEQLKDILPSLMLSIIMGTVVYSINFMGLDTWLTLLLQILVGTMLYFGLAYIFRLECFRYLLTTCKDILKSKNGGAT
jgi:O-antigen/teichoic acid export membrane protein